MPIRRSRQSCPSDVPLVGEIVTSGISKERVGGATANESWRALDQQWNQRWDYALLRQTLQRSPIPQVALPSFGQCVEEGLTSLVYEEVWGVVSILAQLVGQKYTAYASSEQRQWAATKLHERLFQRLPSIRHAERGCALARVLALGAVDKINYLTGSVSTSTAELRELLDMVESHVSRIDRDWIPGRSISLYGLRGERRLFLCRPTDLAMQLSAVLFNVRGAVQAAYKTLMFEADMDTLLCRVARFAFSSWRMLRLNRPQQPSQRAVQYELLALQRASQAARDAGDIMTSTRLVALLLYSVPEKHRAHYMRIADAVAIDVRECGLTVPPWFTRPQETSRRKRNSCLQEEIHSHSPVPMDSEPSLVVSAEIEVKSPRTNHRVDVISPFDARLANDFTRDPDWKIVAELADQNAVGGAPMQVLHRLALRLAKNPEAFLPGSFAIFNLLCRYRRIRTLFYLLHSSPSVADALAGAQNLLRLSNVLLDGMSALPLILHQKSYIYWRSILSTFWARIPAVEFSDQRDIYQVHETMLGRGLAFTRSMPLPVADVNWKAYQEEFTEEELAEILDSDVRFIHASNRGQVWGIPALQSSLAAAPCKTVFLSVAFLGAQSDEFSVVAFTKSGHGFADRVKDAAWRLIEQARAVAAVNTQFIKIAWPDCPGIEAIAAKILEACVMLRVDPDWILLATEPVLARVPWQDLLSRLGFRGGVSLVPSAEWFVRATHPRFERRSEGSGGIATAAQIIVPWDGRKFAEAPDGGTDYAALRLCDALRQDLGILRKNFRDAIFVLGHGIWDHSRKLTSIFKSSELSESELNSAEFLPRLASKEIVVLHVCNAGHVVLKTLGDYDGIVSVCLARRTRAFLAPIVNVASETAGCLHGFLTKSGPPYTLGERYLAAVRSNSQVGLYTYYGIPWLA